MEHARSPSENPLATEPIGRLIAKFAVPAIIGMLVNAIYNIVDQIFIGQDLGLLGIGATNVAFPLVTICTALALLVGVGAASGYSLNLGAGRTEDASNTVGTGLTFALTSGLLLGLIAFVFVGPLMYVFGATEETLPYAIEYTRIIAIGIPFQVFSTAACHLIRADGSPTYSMSCMIAGAIFNVIFDPIFLFVFDMGIAGIAWATSLGQMLSSAIAAVYLIKWFKSAPLKRKHLGLRPGTIKTISSLGAASCFNQLTMVVVQIVMHNLIRYYGALSVYGSNIPLACVGLVSKINFIYMSFTIGTSQGCQPITGFNYGAKNYPRVKKAYKTAAVTVTVISVVAFLLFQFFPRQLISIFGETEPLYLQFCERYFRIALLMTFANGLQPITSGFFTSIGKSTRGIAISLTRQIIFLLPLLLLLCYIFGIDGMIYAPPIADAAAAILAVLFVRHEFRIMGKSDGGSAGGTIAPAVS